MVGTIAQIKEYIETLPNDDTVYDFDKHRYPRSKDSNAYFHVLADKLSVKLGTSKQFMKNVLVSKYGKVMRDDNGDSIIYKTNATPEFMMELERPHSICIRVTSENEKPVYWYRIYENTDTYNSKEMSTLIDGTIEDCKEQGIETMPPEKLEQLMKAWAVNYG